MLGVMIGTPKLGRPCWCYVESLLSLKSPHGWPRLLQTTPKPRAPGVARNWIVNKFLESDCEWLFWMDDDADIHPETLLRLLAWEKPIVGALSFTKGVPVAPTVYSGLIPEKGDHSYVIQVHYVQRWLELHPELLTPRATMLGEIPENALFDVGEGFTGCHCLLTHRMVYEQFGPPWFIADPTLMQKGADRNFCEQAVENGLSVYVDMSITTGHAFGGRCSGALDFYVWYGHSEWHLNGTKIGIQGVD